MHGQSPLYYLGVRSAVAALGDTRASVRALSLLAGALVPLLGFLAARPLGARAAGTALLLLALDPSLVQQAETARPYALAQLGALAALAGLARATRGGSAAWRLVAWSGALVAVYAHYVFAPIVPALVLGALLSEERGYRPRQVALDAALALVALAPALRHMGALLARRDELAWVEHASLAPLGALLPARARWFVLAGLLFGLARGGVRGRGILGAAAASAALAAGALLLLRAAGSNIIDERYVALGAATVPLASAWAIARLPRPAAALALAVIAVLSVRHYHDAGRARIEPSAWSEARAALDALAPGDAPIVVEPGFVEAALVVRPGRAGPELRGFLASPLEDHPGLPATGRRYVFLSSREMDALLDAEVLPALQDAPRFLVIASPRSLADLDSWLAPRLARHSRCSSSVTTCDRRLRVALYASP